MEFELCRTTELSYNPRVPARNSPNQKPLDPLSVAAGARVIRLREERDLAPQQLADLAGMDANYLWRIEQGRQNLSLRNIARLAKALGVTISELLEGIDATAVALGARSYVKRAASAVGDSKDGSDREPSPAHPLPSGLLVATAAALRPVGPAGRPTQSRMPGHHPRYTIVSGA